MGSFSRTYLAVEPFSLKAATGLWSEKPPGGTAVWPGCRSLPVSMGGSPGVPDAPTPAALTRPTISVCSASPPSPAPGVSKIVTVDVKGTSPLWLKVKDLAEGMTYRFRIRAKTFTYGPEIEANVTTGPGEGRRASGRCGSCRPPCTALSAHPPGRRGIQSQAGAWRHGDERGVAPGRTYGLGGLQTRAETQERERTGWAWGEGRGVGAGVRKGARAEEGLLRHRMLLRMPVSSGVPAISAESWAPGNQNL